MQRLVYYLDLPLLWLISVLPFSVLYLFSDFICFIVYRIIGYRNKIVTQNLKNAFPEKSATEIRQIKKKFYQHFCDLFLEMIKTASISKKQLNKRFKLKNPKELGRIQNFDKSLIMVFAHYASYEWCIALPYQGLNVESYGIYKKIKNKYFDRLIKSIRAKHGSTLLDAKTVQRTMIHNSQASIAAGYAMIADQSPKKARTKYWREFLGREVPVFIGSEVLAKKLDLSVVYLKIEKPKRGHYEAEVILLAENPSEFKDYELTDRYFELLEGQIKKEPAFYLWSHRRWKHAEKPKN